MNLPVLIPATVPIAELPRVFLHPEVPGYLSERGTYCLPLTLGPEAVDTGIPRENVQGMGQFVLDRGDRFAHEDPEFQFHLSRDDYLDQVRPGWVRDAVERVGATIHAYEQSASSSSPTVERQVLAPLKAQWKDVRRLINASLYMGPGIGKGAVLASIASRSERCAVGNGLSLFTHDLSFFGSPLTNLHGLLQFLRAFHGAHALLSTGMTDRLQVRTRTRKGVRPLMDPMATQPEPDFEHIDPLGNVRLHLKAAARPLAVLEADKKGRVKIEDYRARIDHPAYGDFQETVLRQGQIFLGLFLCAHYDLGSRELEALASDSETMFFDDPTTAVIQKLRRLGRSFEGDALGFQASLVSRALTTFFGET